MPERNSTADRTIDILLMFDDDHATRSAAEIAARLRMPRSTTYRYLRSLRDCGLIEENDGTYRLGAMIFRLARVARRGMGVLDLALPVMRELNAKTGETILLSRWTGADVVIVDSVDSSNPLRITYERGFAAPLHASAAARVLLAQLAPERLQAALAGRKFEKYTAKTTVDRRALERELIAVRARGYALNDGEVDAGVRAIAAASGPEYSLSVVCPAQRLPLDKVRSVAALVMRASGALAQRLVDLAA